MNKFTYLSNENDQNSTREALDSMSDAIQIAFKELQEIESEKAFIYLNIVKEKDTSKTFFDFFIDEKDFSERGTRMCDVKKDISIDDFISLCDYAYYAYEEKWTVIV